MDYEYGNPYYTKASSPLKPRFLKCGQDRHNGGDMQAVVSAMCEHLLEGDSNRLEEQQRGKKTSPPRERGLQCDGGYTMYSPVYTGPDGNISPCARAYNADCHVNARKCLHDCADCQKNECSHRLGSGRYPTVSGDSAENTCHHAYLQSFHPYDTRAKDTSSLEPRVMSYIDQPVQWKSARRKKRHDKKINKKKPKCSRECNQNLPSEQNVNAEWMRLVLANQANARKMDAEVGWELINSTAPLLSKGSKELFQEILELKARSERKRNREQESNVSLSNSSYSDWCRDWKASKLSRNVPYEKSNGAAHEKGETEGTSFSDGKFDNNYTMETSYSGWEEMPKVSNRNLSRTSANADWLRCERIPDNDDAFVEIDTGNIQYSNAMRYHDKSKSRYNRQCDAVVDGRATHEATNRSKAQDLPRAPWKCTVWKDRVAELTSQELAWSCEMYSCTNLCEPDVGMACTDRYRSYIDARNRQKAMNDFGCQENLREDRSLKLVNSAITQTEENCLETAAKTTQSQAVQLDRIYCNCTGQNNVLKLEKNVTQTKFDSPKINVSEQKRVTSEPTLVNQKQYKTTTSVNEKAVKIERESSNNEDLKCTFMAPSAHSIKVANLLKHRAEPLDAKSELIPNVLAASESRIPEIHSLVGNPLNEGIGQIRQITDEDVYRNALSTAYRPVKEASSQEKEKENIGVFTDGRGEENVVISKAIQDVINQNYDKISPYQHDMGEKSIKWCSRQVCAGAESCGESIQEGKTSGKRTHQLLLHGGTKKLEERMNSQKEMQDYERYKEGRKKYEDELAQKGCNFEIEELKFQKQVSCEPMEKECTGENSQNSISGSLNRAGLDRIRLLNEPVQLLDSSGSMMNSPLTTTNQSEVDEEMRTDACFSYHEKCYMKGTPPPGDRYDMVPCLTCSRSTSRETSSRSLSAKQQKSRNKSLGRRKKEEEKRKSLKSVRKRSSVSPRKSGYSPRDSSSDEEPVKKGKKPLKRYKNQGRKPERNMSKIIERSTPRKVPGLISTQSEMSSSISSSSMSYNPLKISSRSKEPEKSTEEAVDCKESTLHCSSLPSKENRTISKSIRSEVKKHLNVTSPELLNWISMENQKITNKSDQSSSKFLSHGDSISKDVKQNVKKRGVNNSKSDPFSSLNTAELNLSIIKLYTEIQKLQHQLELSRDESDIQSRTDKCVKNSPSSDSADKTLACSSRCQSLPDNNVCDSLSDTPKQMSYSNNQCESKEWIKSRKIHLKEEKAHQLSRHYRKQRAVPYPVEMQKNGASNILCRSDSPEKILKRKVIPRDTSMNRASNPLYTKLAAPCVKSWKQSNSHKRANRKQNSPSPSGGPADQCSSCSEDDNANDESVAGVKYTSSNTERRDANVKNLTVASNFGIDNAQARENFRLDREKKDDAAPQKETRDPKAFPSHFNEEMQKHISSRIECPCFEDNLHLHLTSALSDRNIDGEARCGDAFNYCCSGNDDLRSARSYVCSSSWLSASNHQIENGDALGNCSNLMSPDDEKSEAVCVKQQGQVKLLTDKNTGDGNNSKLDELETLSEYNLRFETKIPTTATCRKLKVFGATREQTLRFYTSSVLNGGQNRSSVWTGLTLSPPPTVASQRVSMDELPRAEFKASQNEEFREPVKKKVARDDNPAESRKSPSAKEEDRGGRSLWSTNKKPKIPYTVPQRRRRSGSDDIGTETSLNIASKNNVSVISSSNEADARLNKQTLAVGQYNADPVFQEEGCDSKRRKCPPRYFARPNVRQVKIESPVEKILELLTEKPDRAMEKARPNLTSDARKENAFGYEEGLAYRRKSSPDTKKTKVFQPNETYSEFERSPRGDLYSPISLSKFLQQNVQQIAEYIQSFRENGTIDKTKDQNGAGKNLNYDRQDSWGHHRKNYESGMSSNNIYGQRPIEEPTMKTYLENKTFCGEECEFNHRSPNASRKFSNQLETAFEESHITLTPQNSPQSGSNTPWANSSDRIERRCTVHGLDATNNNQPKIAHIRSEINDLLSCNAQCPYGSIPSQTNISYLTPQSEDSNPQCAECAPRSRVLVDRDNESSPYLTAVTENNNSNHGCTSPNYNNFAERPSTSSSAAHPANRSSRPEKAIATEFGPEKVSYISYKKIKSQPKPGTLNNPHVHGGVNMTGMDSLKTLNLVGCVKDIFFKSFKPDLGEGPREMGDHACPPKPSVWPRSKTIGKPGDTEKTYEVSYGKGNKKLEETILCEYIAGRKQKHLHGENHTKLSTRKLAPDTDRHLVQPNYTTSQRHGAQGDSSREAKLSLANDQPSNEAMKDPVRRHDDGCLQVNPLGDNKNSLLPCNEVKICSHEKCCPSTCTMPKQSKWKGDKHRLNIYHHEMLTADSNKAIPHYSDAIRTGSWRSRTSALPFGDAFSDDAKKYVSVKHSYTPAGGANDEAQNEGSTSREKCFAQTYPKNEDLNSRGEGSIMSSFEKMMQDKRPCFAEHCKLQASDSKMESDKHRNNFGYQHPLSHPAQTADDNNSSNETVDNGLTPPCINVPTSRMANACQNELAKKVNNYTDLSGQEYSTPTTPCRKMHYVNGGTAKLSSPWKDQAISKTRNNEDSGDCREALLNLSIDSSEQRFVLENCSEILFRENRDELSAVKDNSRGDVVGSDAWENVSSQDPICEDIGGIGLDYDLVDLSLNLTKDDGDIMDNGNCSAEEGNAEDGRDFDDACRYNKFYDYVVDACESVAPVVSIEDKLSDCEKNHDDDGYDGVGEAISESGDVSDASSDSDTSIEPGPRRSDSVSAKSSHAGSESCDSRDSSDSDVKSGDPSDVD